jgi:hypothetical protein
LRHCASLSRLVKSVVALVCAATLLSLAHPHTARNPAPPLRCGPAYLLLGKPCNFTAPETLAERYDYDDGVTLYNLRARERRGTVTPV